MNALIWEVVAGLAALIYGFTPIVTRYSTRMQAEPEFEPLAASDLPPALAEWVYGTAATLREDGFVPEAYLALPNQMPNTRAYLILMVSRHSGDKAMATAIISDSAGVRGALQNCYLEFSTRFASGKIVMTLNSKTLGSFDQEMPNETRIYFPYISNPHALYQLHQHVMDKFAGIAPTDEKVLYPEGEAVLWMKEILRKVLEEQAQLGVLKRSPTGDAFYPTWIGAYRMTWQLLPPLLQLRRKAEMRKADAVFRSYRASIEGKPL